MEQKQLSYEAFKSILKHTEANKRFKYAAACPSIQSVDKSVPLLINHLMFYSDYTFRVNHKLYTLGIIREYPDKPPTSYIQEENERGGVDCDLDEWGFERPTYRLVKTPGDLVFRELKRLEGDEDYTEMMKTLHEAWLQQFEVCYHKVCETDDDMTKKAFASCIDREKTALLPYYYQETNTKPPYKPYIQLSFAPKPDYYQQKDYQYLAEPIERVPYDRKLYDAMKSLMHIMLGGRKFAIKVKCLDVAPQVQVVRLPKEIKFNIHQLKIFNNLETISNSLLPVLDGSCLPIKHIIVCRISELDHPFIKNAEEVTIDHDGSHQNVFKIAHNLPQLRINFLELHISYHSGNVIAFIKNLLRNGGRRIGTTYQFGLRNEQQVMEVLDLIEKQWEKRTTVDIDNGRLVLQMKNSKEIRISYRRNVIVIDEYNRIIRLVCLLKIEVASCQEAK